MEVRASSIKLRVWEASGGLALRAEIHRVPDHPRALLWLLEGLALRSGAPLPAVISAGGFGGPSLDESSVPCWASAATCRRLSVLPAIKDPPSGIDSAPSDGTSNRSGSDIAAV